MFSILITTWTFPNKNTDKCNLTKGKISLLRDALNFNFLIDKTYQEN